MKKILLFLCMLAGVLLQMGAQTCSTCGSVGGSGMSGSDIGPSFITSMGTMQYGQSAGNLTFNSSLPNVNLFTPLLLRFDAPTQPGITVITTNVAITITPMTTVTEMQLVVTTNTLSSTIIVDESSDTTVVTSPVYDLHWALVVKTNPAVIVTNAVILQVRAPQSIADVPTPPTTNGYVINFYFPSQVAGQSNGLDYFSGQPFTTWLITNTSPGSINQLQISRSTPTDGVIKQWVYNYSGGWSVQPLGGAIQENMSIANLGTNIYQVINTTQAPSGPVVQQAVDTYQIFDWGVAPIAHAVGSTAAPEVTAYAYPSSPNAGSQTLVQTVTHPDGSWEYYANYDDNGNPLTVYSSFQDVTLTNYYNGRETVYTYTPDVVYGSGDDGSLNSTDARQAINYINGNEIGRQYTAFPSAGVRLDIQCTAAGAGWNASGNLITTNLFYTSGPNRYCLQAVIRPDGTMSTYDYLTNGTYQTNIIVTGQPDSTYTHIVDGVSNRVILSLWGDTFANISWDVKSGLLLNQDNYGNSDSFGRYLQVTHLDGTTEYTEYACCGLDETIDKDGVTTQYLYDPAKRRVGYDKIYAGSPITYTNVLDAAGRTLASIRIGSDNSSIVMSQSAYDQAGELIAQTNALNGRTTRSRNNDPVTGGLVWTTINPNGGTVTNFYYADGSLKKTIGTGVHGQVYTYGTGTDVNGNACTYTVVTNLNTDGSLSSEWTETFTDMDGRETEMLYADGHYNQSFYNGQGQLSKQIDPDGEIVLYQYNAKGELAYTAKDMDQNGSIDFSGADRISSTVNDVTTDHSVSVNRTRTYVWNTFSSNTSNLVSSVESSTDGLNTWQTTYADGSTPVTMHSQTSPGTSRTVTTTAPDNSYNISVYAYGRLASNTHYDSASAQISGTTYNYDAHGHQYASSDARNGATTAGFNNADLVASVTTPNSGGLGGSPQTTYTYYNTSLQATNTVLPDSTSVLSQYLLTGELGEQYGSRTYPVAYSYDYAGRMKTMTNWSNFSGNAGARVTTWSYDSQRGFLTGKTYDGGAAGPAYTYTGAGRLATRAWARGITTTYAYDPAGSLTNISYSDSTPAVATTYDRLGRASTIVNNGMTDTLAYNLANQLLSESYSGGILNALSVTNGYDQYLRRTNLVGLAAATLNRITYGYDNASRLASVNDGNNNSAAYSYVANSPLVSQIVFKQNGTTRMTTVKQYDNLNRLTGITSTPSAANAISFSYGYNAANQRTHNTLGDGSYWLYQYDALGQVTSANKYWSDGNPVAGQQFDYAFDTIGNRTKTQSGGDQSGANLRTANYLVNNLNQITNRDVPAYVDIKGVSFATNIVAVNGQTAYQRGEYFRDELAVNNSSSALWTNLIVTATGQTSMTGNVFVAQSPEVFKYDADGNLTNDGRFVYSWDAENRLTNLTSLATAPTNSRVKLDFAYDSKGRRIQKIVSTNNGTVYIAASTNKFLYDGWNLIAETAPNNTLIRSYVWGTDLSGSPQGAGGVGGLLEVSYYGSSTTNCFPAFDGNGNVSELINGADGTIAANYDYAAFGEPIRITGAIAKLNPFRFSTKYDDDETDLLYYGYRYYKPNTGAWPNRDSIGERGGRNLYGFVGGNPISRVDRLGHDYILQCGIMKPSDFNPPGPTTPSRSDQYNPNGFFGTARPGGELDQTAWFESHYSGWTSEMKRRITEQMEKEMKSACRDGKKPGQITMSDLNTEIIPTMSGDPPPFPFRASTSNPRTPEAGGNEENYGDSPQSAVWADQVLGRFVYEVNSANVTWADTPSGKCYHWSVALVVTDGMGLNDPDDGLRRALGETGSAHFFPARREARARWTLSGCGCCPCPPAK